MTMPQTSFLSDIAAGKEIPHGELAYFRERQRNRLYDLIVSEFLKRQQDTGLTKADIARRIHKSPEQITRWLGAPGNWTLDTVSDLLLAIAASELEFNISPLLGRQPRNYNGPDWIQATRTYDAPSSNITLITPPPQDVGATTSTSANVYSIQSFPHG